jgi:hypothetical protein
MRGVVDIISGKPEEFARNVVLLVSGAKVFLDGREELPGLHPAWCTSHFALITGRKIPKSVSSEARKAVVDDITFVRGTAMKKLAPNTGGCMNEEGRHDPEYISIFDGRNCAAHLETKIAHDPAVYSTARVVLAATDSPSGQMGEA